MQPWVGGRPLFGHCFEPDASGARSPRRRHPSAHRPRLRGADAHSEGQARARSHPEPPADSRRHHASVRALSLSRLARTARMARTRPCPKRARWHRCRGRWASGCGLPSVAANAARHHRPSRSPTQTSPGISLAPGDCSPLSVHRLRMRLRGPSCLLCAETLPVRRPPHPIWDGEPGMGKCRR